MAGFYDESIVLNVDQECMMPVPRLEDRLIADYGSDLGRVQGKRWLVAGVWGMSPHMMLRAAKADLQITTSGDNVPLLRALSSRQELFYAAYVMGAMEEMLRPRAASLRNVE